ncbi:MAG: TIGR00730 family Rossman fold protein [Deltaproteobacteria bacterium]|nr:MAG: TIGR00730 family Rossman fold protein [Deltaproteobacteria bacterium]
MPPKTPPKCFPSASDDVKDAALCVISPQTESDSYKLAFDDSQFLLRDELRAVRLQLEIMKPEIIQHELGVKSTVVIFGGARIPDPETAAKRLQEEEMQAKREPLSEMAAQRVSCAKRVLVKSNYYEEARELARIITESCLHDEDCDLIVSTGGGPGIMEAANRGAAEAGGKSIGLNIVLPHEQAPNEYITPELCFQFHYFAMRKMHFLMRARVLVAFPGGYGTMDELFETLTLIQTKKIRPLPVILFGREFWNKAIDFDFLVQEGVIAPEDKNLFHTVEKAQDAWKIIQEFYYENKNET